MEPLTWFGAYGSSFAPLLLVLVTLAITCGLCAALLAFIDNTPRASFSVFNGVAVLLLLLVGFTYVYGGLTGVEGGAMPLSTLGWMLATLAGLAIFAAMLAWFLDNFFDNPRRLHGHAVQMGHLRRRRGRGVVARRHAALAGGGAQGMARRL